MNRAPRSLVLAFAGTPEFALPALDALAASRHRVAAVFTQPDRPAGRGRGLHESPVKRRARELGLAVHQPAGFKSPEAVGLLQSLGVDAWVVVAYGSILPPAALAVPPLGCFNIHASLLPRWRGAAPIQRALLAGDKVTGVSIMRMEAGLDTGPVLAVGRIDIHPSDTAGALHDRLAALGGRLIVDSMDAVAAGTSMETPQAQGASYAAKIDKSEALIDWRESARALERKIRAFNPWPVAETRLHGIQLRLWEAQVASDDGESAAAGAGEVRRASPEGIEVACGRGTLRITRLQLAGRKALAAAEFLHAQPLAGARLGAA